MTFHVPKLTVPKIYVPKLHVPKLTCTENDLPLLFYIWLSALEYYVPVAYSYSKLRVAYNDAFRQLLHEPRWCSASRLFVFHNASSFFAIIRKLVYSLLCSLRDSNNLLVCAMFHSDICLQSSLFERWHKLLPVHVF